MEGWGRGGGVLAVSCFAPNERQAKLTASFDPEGIKMVLRVEVERAGLPPFSSCTPHSCAVAS